MHVEQWGWTTTQAKKSFDDLSHSVPWSENFLGSTASTVGFPLIFCRISQLHSFSCDSGRPAQLWTRLFHRKRKRVPAEQVVSGQEGVAACKEEAQEAEASKCQVSIRHALFQLNHSGVTFQVQRRLCNKHSSRALESAGITECCSKVTMNIGPCVFRKRNGEICVSLLNRQKMCGAEGTYLGLLKQSQGPQMNVCSCNLDFCWQKHRRTPWLDKIKNCIKMLLRRAAEMMDLDFLVGWQKTLQFFHLRQWCIERGVPLDSEDNKYRGKRPDLLTTFHCTCSLELFWLYQGL